MTVRAARAVALASGMLALLALVPTAQAAPVAPALPPLLLPAAATPVPGKDAIPVPVGTPAAQVMARKGLQRTRLPRAATAHLTPGRATPPRPATVGDLPVTLTQKAGPTGPLEVAVLDRATARRARLAGVLLRLTPRPESGLATVRLSVGYAQFADSYGGGWSSRLALWRVPSCGLLTPSAAGCQATALPSTVDTKSATVAANVPVASSSAIIALAAAAAGSTGDFTASPLSPSASWQAGGSSGDFSWSYPLRVPPVPGDLAPSLSLSYDAGSVDGRTAAQNSQASAIGEGWDLSPGFIERSYRTCSDDGTSKQTPDRCWGPDNLTMSLNGRAVALVKDDTSGTWRPRQDDGSRLDRLTDTTNGTNGNEYWRLTTQDGTQYLFGRNQLPGFTTGKTPTNSAWTLPVFGNNTDEPCPSGCQQAWRWNLDYVKDIHGNAIAYYYNAEPNKYGPSALAYTRGGYLDHVDYGMRDGHAYDTNAAAAQVVFGATDRCDPAVSGCTSWPDTPRDQTCTAAPCSATQAAPTFWSQKRLTSITTRVLRSTGYSDVDGWTLTQSFPVPGDDQSPTLWLTSIVHKGLVGATIALPPVTFDPILLQNRVDPTTFPAQNKPRISEIHTETGGRIDVNYAPQQCTPTTLPASADSDTMRCFAQYWSPPAEGPRLDWFHKYVVDSVTQSDPIGNSVTVETHYAYLGGAAWHFADTDEITPPAKRTWSQWRGYAEVQTRQGSTSEGQTLADDRYYRGMAGDQLGDGTLRTASVSDSQGGSVTDSDGLAGQNREHTIYNGPTGSEVAGTINTPFQSTATAQHTHDSLTVAAYQVRLGDQAGRVDITGGRPRKTLIKHGYDSDGRLVSLDDQGDTATSGDDLCTTTAYAEDRSKWLLDLAKTITVVGVTCGATPKYPDNAVSLVRNYYDNSTTLGAIPAAGDLTKVETAKAFDASGATGYATISAGYDALGRVTAATDELNRTTTTSYTGVPTTSTVVTSPAASPGGAGMSTTATFDPAWGTPTSTRDTNSRVIDQRYDALGRLTQVWLPDRPQASNTTGSIQFAYQVSNTAASWQRVDKLAPSSTYLSTYTLFDGLARRRQVQAPADTGASGSAGRMVSDTFYNSRGEPYLIFDPYFSANAPTSTLLNTVATNVPHTTVTTFDGADRPAIADNRSLDHELWKTTYSYAGDHVDVTPPAGGTATSTYTDARGHTTELRQFQSTTPTGDYDSTTYAYTHTGQLAKVTQLTNVTDPAGLVWSYEYDPLGRQTSATDPDSGTTTSHYDDAGQVTSVTDHRGTTLAYSYDGIGRKTGEFTGSLTGTQLAGWTYDTAADTDGLPTAGLPASSIRYIGGQPAITNTIDKYDADSRPTKSTTTIAGSQTGLDGSYTTNLSYTIDGQLLATGFPAAGGLTAETVQTVYDAAGLPFTLKSSTATYVTGSDYTTNGQPSLYTLATGGGPTVQLSYTFDTATQRLTHTKLFRQVSTGNTPSDIAYTYDDAGNLTIATDTGTGHATDAQCFTYDYLRRLTQAWTPASNPCSTAPTSGAGVLGGPAPYWNTYTYDKTGNRTTAVQHDPAGTATNDVTHTYTYPAITAAQPHTLSSVTTTGPGSTHTDTYTYDADGNTTSRPAPSGSQTLTWDSENRLVSVGGGSSAGGADYTYDADGNRLLEHDTTGATLYLPNGMELRWTKTTNTTTATRYYTHNGTPVAARTTAGVTWLAADPHGTVTFAVRASDATVSTRRTDPFGNIRGTAPPSWVDTHGFLDKPIDPATGLTHLGARDYDSTAGRFTSLDPVIDPTDPQQLNGYAYANNNPPTNTDPTGLLPALACAGDDTGSCSTHGVRIGGSPPPVPDDSDTEQTPSITGYGPHGTVGTQYSDGSGFVNDVELPNGGPSADKLATAADTYAPAVRVLNHLGENDALDPAQTLQMLEMYCASQASGCSTGFMMRLALLAANANGTVGPPGPDTIHDAGITAAAVTGAGVTVRRNYHDGNAAADRIASQYPGSTREVNIETKLGYRRIDILAGKQAIEVKSGRVYSTRRIRAEIAKDKELLADPNSGVTNIKWVFVKSPVTGRVGPSDTIQAELRKAGISIEVLG